MMIVLVDYALNFTQTAPNKAIIHATSASFDWFSLIPVFAALVGSAIAGIIALIIARSQRKLQEISTENQRSLQEISYDYQQKELDLTSMLEVYKLLNHQKHRLAREVVYCAYKHGNDDTFKREPYRGAAAMVRADMDQIGLLIDDGLLDDEKFLKGYWNTVLLTWKALEKNIELERKKRSDYPSYMINFEKLKEKADKYVKNHDLGSGDPEVYQEEGCIGNFNGLGDTFQ